MPDSEARGPHTWAVIEASKLMTTGQVGESSISISSPTSLARYNRPCRPACLPAGTRASWPSISASLPFPCSCSRNQSRVAEGEILKRDKDTKGIGMNLGQEMDREQMRMAILNQEQIFRQQVHELHRLYHVQKHLMQQQQHAAPASRVPVAAAVDVKPRPQPQQLDVWCGEKATTAPPPPPPQQQIISFSTSCTKATTQAAMPASALADECNLELTLATGPSSSSSNSSCDAERQHRQGKRLKASSNSDSVSSTSTDSELVQFREVVGAAATPARFHGEVGRRMDEMAQGPWMYRCLSLRTA